MSGISKRAARSALFSSPPTWGALRRLLERSKDGARDGPSSVNPSIPHRMAIDVLLAGIKDRNDDDLVNLEGRQVLIAENILRECGEP